MNQKKQTRKSTTRQLEKNTAEWLVFTVSAMLLTGLVCYLVYETFTHEPSTPDLVVSYKQDPTSNQPFRYRVIVENSGGETAEDVWVDAQVLRAGEVIERAELKIAFSPKYSKREGWILFTNKPAPSDSLSVKITSYKKT